MDLTALSDASQETFLSNYLNELHHKMHISVSPIFRLKAPKLISMKSGADGLHEGWWADLISLCMCQL
jgi:hypothetical protein